jgi:CRISPR-associated protein Cas1
VDDQFLSVASLHALIYCERLFYLEEVERIRVADASVFAGRRLHQEIELAEDEAGVERESLASEELGVRGTVDVIRRRNGALIPYEHKRGRAAGKKGAREAWATDRVQVGAYAMLLEQAYGQRVEEGRVRYHADQVTVRVPVDDDLRGQVVAAIARGREVRRSIQRPPVTSNERLCVRCSLAPVCLPEETRLGADADFMPISLLPQHPDGQTVHVLEHGATVGRSGDELKVRTRDGGDTALPSAEVGQLVLHGFAQVTTQAFRLCVERDIGVHWVTLGGGVIGSLAPGAAAGQRHLRQFAALSDGAGSSLGTRAPTGPRQAGVPAALPAAGCACSRTAPGGRRP